VVMPAIAFLADRVKLESTKDDRWHHHDHHGDYDRAELEGLITRFESPTESPSPSEPAPPKSSSSTTRRTDKPNAATK